MTGSAFDPRMIDVSLEMEETLEQALRSYRDRVRGAYSLVVFLADITERVGCIEHLSVRTLAEEQGVGPNEVHLLFMFLDQLQLGHYSRQRQRFTFHFDPSWIGYLAMNDEERKVFDEFYG